MTKNEKTINDYLDMDIPLLIEGEPGTGKTQIITQIAAARRAHLEVVIASSRDATDILGIYRTTADGSKHDTPTWARNIQQALTRGQEAIVFFDEITCVPPATQAPLLRVIEEACTDDWSIRGCKRLMACNPPEHAAGGWELSLPFLGRVAKMSWSVSLDAWADYMMSCPDFPVERAQIVGFLKSRPSLLLQVPPDGATGAFPSPRSWEKAAKMLSRGIQYVAMVVGEGPGMEFAAWRKHANLPRAEELLAGTKSLPSKPDELYASFAALAAYAIEHPRKAAEVSKILVAQSTHNIDLVIPAARAICQHLKDVPPELTALLPRLRDLSREA